MSGLDALLELLAHHGYEGMGLSRQAIRYRAVLGPLHDDAIRRACQVTKQWGKCPSPGELRLIAHEQPCRLVEGSVAHARKGT